ncbi:50S ribosomal protein L23 [Candidatus Paracaedibacter symbiosus]|uniref:50S ribosomal protein L23 n=1 Tax=Candidatus Paracaedibacter symbiosus TaxID=244582 RepID=UPI0005095758|nr:50S ribosomal protein L23 [Candidatus Paracaedibacter symbiosus]
MKNINKVDISLFDVISSPLVTEKSTRQSENNQVAFIVNKTATKQTIKSAVELAFNVKVDAVNTLILKGKQKRFRGRLGQQSNRKKAIVTLAKGQTIDIASGI